MPFPFDAVKKILAYFRGTDPSLSWLDAAQSLLDVEQWVLNQARGGGLVATDSGKPCELLSCDDCCRKLEALAAAQAPGTSQALNIDWKGLLASLIQAFLSKLLSA